MGFGKNVSTQSQTSKQPLTPHLGATDGRGCTSVFAPHLRSNNTMQEFVEEVGGVEVIADNFLIAGFGKTADEVHKSLEKNERAFLGKCRLWSLKLNKA